MTLDLNEVKEIAAVAGSFFKGYERQYFFDIAVSEDGENWTVVLTDQASSGTTDEGVLEMFTFRAGGIGSSFGVSLVMTTSILHHGDERFALFGEQRIFGKVGIDDRRLA